MILNNIIMKWGKNIDYTYFTLNWCPTPEAEYNCYREVSFWDEKKMILY